jgi:hypothetical protein
LALLFDLGYHDEKKESLPNQDLFKIAPLVYTECTQFRQSCRLQNRCFGHSLQVAVPLIPFL